MFFVSGLCCDGVEEVVDEDDPVEADEADDDKEVFPLVGLVVTTGLTSCLARLWEADLAVDFGGFAVEKCGGGEAGFGNGSSSARGG